jgi:ribonuclease HI
MYFDGSVLGTGVGASIILVSPSGDRLRYAIRLHFPTSNNMAEYEACIHGLRIATDLGVRHLYVRGESKLVVDQVMKDASCRGNKMTTYCDEVCKLEERFNGIERHHILQHDNEVADFLAKLALSRELASLGIFINDACEPSVKRDRSPGPLDGPSAPDHALATAPDLTPGATERTDPSKGGGEGSSQTTKG